MRILFSDTGGRPLFFDDLDLLQTNERNNVLDFWKDQSPFVIEGFDVIDSTTLGPGKAIIDGDIVEKSGNTSVTSYPVYIQKAADVNTDTETYNDSSSKDTKTVKTVDVVESEPSSGEYITVTEAGGADSTFADILAAKHTHTHFNSKSNPHEVTLEQARSQNQNFSGDVDFQSGLRFTTLSGSEWIQPPNGDELRIGGSGSGDVHNVFWNRVGTNGASYAFHIILKTSTDVFKIDDGRLELNTGTSVNEIVTAISSPTDDQLATAQAIQEAIDAHSALTNNPHTVTLEQARLANNTVSGDVDMGGNDIVTINQIIGNDNGNHKIHFTTESGGTDSIDFFASSGNRVMTLNSGNNGMRLAIGTEVNEIVTSISSPTDLQLATAQAVQEAIDAHGNLTNNPHSVTLEQARSENNTVSGDIDMGSSRLINTQGIYSSANSVQGPRVRLAVGDVFIEPSDGSTGNITSALVVRDTTGDVEVASKIYKSGYNSFSQHGTTDLYYRILPDGRVDLKGQVTFSSTGTDIDESLPVTPSAEWRFPLAPYPSSPSESGVIELNTDGSIQIYYSGANSAGQTIDIDNVVYDPNATV